MIGRWIYALTPYPAVRERVGVTAIFSRAHSAAALTPEPAGDKRVVLSRTAGEGTESSKQ